MANEIKYATSLSVVNGNFKKTYPNEAVSITQATIGCWESVVIVGTSEEDLAPVDITTLGIVRMKNLDTTNYVTYGPKSAGAMVALGRIKPGEIWDFRFEPGITLRWLANTANVKVLITVLEN